MTLDARVDHRSILGSWTPGRGPRARAGTNSTSAVRCRAGSSKACWAPGVPRNGGHQVVVGAQRPGSGRASRGMSPGWRSRADGRSALIRKLLGAPEGSGGQSAGATKDDQGLSHIRPSRATHQLTDQGSTQPQTARSSKNARRSTTVLLDRGHDWLVSGDSPAPWPAVVVGEESLQVGARWARSAANQGCLNA